MRGISGCTALAALLLAVPGGGCTGSEEESAVNTVSVAGAHALIEEQKGNASFVILDVRTPEEYASGHIDGAVNLDYRNSSFEAGVGALDPEKTYLVYCRTGVRGAAASEIMAKKGISKVSNMKGGITAWTTAGYPVV